MRIVVIASGAFAVPTLRRLAESEHDVRLVVTQPARPAGRGRKVTPTPVREWAGELGIEAIEVSDINEPEIVARLRSCEARIGVAIAFGQMLGAEVLGAFPEGCVNLHASLLPKYRGAAPINWAIVRGEERTGCSVFRIVKKLDAGDVLTSRWTLIKPEETAGELHDRLAGIGVDALMAALELFDAGGNVEGDPQDASQVTYAPKLVKSDGYVRFNQPAATVADHICGMTPWPGATARYESNDGRWEKVTLCRARPAEGSGSPNVTPGTLDHRCYAAAADGFVEILEVKPSSGRTMSWPDYVNGRHVKAGDKLATLAK